MFFSTRHKKAFTLIEISIVVVIISIMLSTVLVSRSLIISAKINKIQEEYRGFNTSISIFSSVYDCLPGDCNATQVRDLNSYSSTFFPNNTTAGFVCGAVAAGGSTTYTVAGTGAIDSTAKRTCAMASLAAIGALGGISATTNITTPTGATLAVTTAGVTVPYAKFSRQAVWDLRAVTGGSTSATVSNMLSFPANAGVVGSPTATWVGSHMLVLHSATDATGGTPYDIGQFTGFVPATAVLTPNPATGNQPNYAVPSNLAYRLDTKFDDGLPYSGNIASFRNYIDSISGVVAGASTYSCTQLLGIENATNMSTSTNNLYQASNSVANGCIVTYVL